MLPITEITKFTFQDFPEHTACIIWFGGCNFRCPYCHNPEFIVEKYDTLNEDEVFKFLNSRKGLLEGVVLSGGECTLSNDLEFFIEKIKDMGFLVKIDTNGTNTDLIKNCINKKILDFVALDYKAPKEKFYFISKTELYDKFSKSLDLLLKYSGILEVRTTVHTSLLQEDDINKIIEDLDNRGFNGTYYIQNFRNDNCKTLEDIGNQKYILDKNKLITPKNFNIEYRNF